MFLQHGYKCLELFYNAFKHYFFHPWIISLHVVLISTQLNSPGTPSSNFWHLCASISSPVFCLINSKFLFSKFWSLFPQLNEQLPSPLIPEWKLSKAIRWDNLSVCDCFSFPRDCDFLLLNIQCLEICFIFFWNFYCFRQNCILIYMNNEQSEIRVKRHVYKGDIGIANKHKRWSISSVERNAN